VTEFHKLSKSSGERSPTSLSPSQALTPNATSAIGLPKDFQDDDLNFGDLTKAIKAGNKILHRNDDHLQAIVTQLCPPPVEDGRSTPPPPPVYAQFDLIQCSLQDVALYLDEMNARTAAVFPVDAPAQEEMPNFSGDNRSKKGDNHPPLLVQLLQTARESRSATKELMKPLRSLQQTISGRGKLDVETQISPIEGQCPTVISELTAIKKQLEKVVEQTAPSNGAGHPAPREDPYLAAMIRIADSLDGFREDMTSIKGCLRSVRNISRLGSAMFQGMLGRHEQALLNEKDPLRPEERADKSRVRNFEEILLLLFQECAIQSDAMTASGVPLEDKLTHPPPLTSQSSVLSWLKTPQVAQVPVARAKASDFPMPDDDDIPGVVSLMHPDGDTASQLSGSGEQKREEEGAVPAGVADPQGGQEDSKGDEAGNEKEKGGDESSGDQEEDELADEGAAEEALPLHEETSKAEEKAGETDVATLAKAGGRTGRGGNRGVAKKRKGEKLIPAPPDGDDGRNKRLRKR
jgi:hypothetical protein